MAAPFEMLPIGTIRRADDTVWIEVRETYLPAMTGLEDFSHIHVFFWFDRNDNPEGRSVLKVHPRRDARNPLTGVFATHSPLRPNLIGMTLCRIEAIAANRIYLDRIDAHEDTPVLDIKCFIPTRRDLTDLRQPDWV
jgi:tRNA-Thr(GGU) m(6)t(6)A37 methyltransferase TsaA